MQTKQAIKAAEQAEPALAKAKAALAERDKEIVVLREALEFYRDGFQYHPKRSKTGVDLSEWKPKQILLDDCGERALAALEARNAGGKDV